MGSGLKDKKKKDKWMPQYSPTPEEIVWRDFCVKKNIRISPKGIYQNPDNWYIEIRLGPYKKGEKGSITFAMNKEIKKGIFPVKPLKPTGAGDAFMGSLIGSILKTNDLEKSIEIGSAAAAIVVTKVGCAPAMPNLNEILEFMKYNKINEGE